MNGELDKALPLLHQRLVIHEKFGPGEAEQAETYQLRSLQVLYDSAEPEDIESEDIPWEVYKRLKQQRGPSTAANSITLLKGNMRKSVMDVVYKSSGALSSTEESGRLDKGETLKDKSLAPKADTITSDDVDRRRVLRSHSETTIKAARGLHSSGNASGRLPDFQADAAFIDEDPLDTDIDPLAQSRITLPSTQSLRAFRQRRDTPGSDNAPLHPTDSESSLRLSSAVPIARAIRDFPTLQQRVESLKRRILAGYPDVNADVARLTADVDRIQARELREVGTTMVNLVREMNRLSVRTDLTQQQLPVLEGMLEKKSASIFRGWEKRWFKVDSKTFILSYHFSKDDYARGFTPRGGFAVSRISNILVQRHARGNHFHFDVVTDEKKKKVKEDVAELLGRKSGGKKKKGSLAKAEPLGGPSLGKANALEKKPLPGLSGRLGSLGPTGLGGGGLKPVAGLGPLKSESKELSGPGLDSINEDSKSDELAKPLSRTPLGTVLGKKPLLSSPSVMAVETQSNADAASSDFEEKRERLTHSHAEKLREIQEAHDKEVEILRKKLKVQIDDMQDAEEMKLKHLKREFDKKKNEMENQFDKEENTLQRSRKEQLKRLETETENALNHKKQDLDREFNSEVEQLRLKHEMKQREIQEGFQQEADKLTEKMKSLFGEKKDAVQLATELKAEVKRLQNHQNNLEENMDVIRSEKANLDREKNAVEKDLNEARSDIEKLRRQLSEANRSEASPSAPIDCTKSSNWEDQVTYLKGECAQAQTEIADLKRDVDARIHAEKQKDSEITNFRHQEAALKQEIAALQQKVAALEVESNELQSKCIQLQNEHDAGQDKAVSIGEDKGQLEGILKQLAAAQAETSSTKSELNDLQDQHAVIQTTNAQIKEQLMKESNERKVLREQLDLKTEETQHLRGEVEKNQLQLQTLEKELERESQARREQASTCDDLRKSIHDLQEVNRKVTAELDQLGSDRCHRMKVHQDEDSERQLRLTDLEKEVGRLHDQQNTLKQELSTIREEKEILRQAKSSAEIECNYAQREVERLQQQLSEVSQLDTPAVASLKCTQCSGLENRILLLEGESAKAQAEIKEVQRLKQEGEIQAAAERENLNAAIVSLQREREEAVKSLEEQESLQKQESAVLQKNLSILEREVTELNAKCDLLPNERDVADQGALATSSSVLIAQQQLKALEQQLAAAQTEADNTKLELTKLQNQHTTLLVTHAQIKDELAKESNDKKAIREQLDTKIKEAAQSIAGTTEKHQQQILVLKQKLENDSRARRDLEEACDALRKEAHTLEQANRKTNAELSQLESDKRHLESEKMMLTLRLDEINVSRKRDEKSVVSVEEALTEKKLEAEQLRANLKVAEVDNGHLAARMKVLTQDFEQLQAKVHHLETENENERRALTKERDAALQRQRSLTFELENAQRQSRTLATDTSELQAQLGKSKTNEQAATSKAEQAAQKMRELEQQKERDDFAMKMKLQQAAVENENTIHAKERAEMQLQAREKELNVARDEITRRESEIDSLQSRIKSLLSDKEEVQAALLNANMVNVASASANRESTKSMSASTDVMLVKLQLADANRNELELHLADISSQLESSTRRCASLEARCRDQSVEIESLHVEVASLRSASQKMHMSALESLALVERLEYEHKKRTMKNDFLTQLRDFQEREEQAFVRHKARLRAQYERRLEELVAELEKMRQQRMEQEEALSVQMVQQFRQERDVKRTEARRQVREELKQYEQELHERKTRDIEILSKVIEKEEEELGARLREVRQVAREEVLAKQCKPQEAKNEESCDQLATVFPAQALNRSSTRKVKSGSMDGGDDDDYEQLSGKRLKASNQLQHSNSYGDHDHRLRKTMKTYQKWKQRLQEEKNLLANARNLVANQREGLTKQAHQLKASKIDWKRSSRSFEGNPIQQEVKRMLDENMANWSEGMKKLRNQEAWIKQREQKLSKMKRTGSESVSDEEGNEPHTNWSDYSSQPEIASTLEKLQRLEEELASDVGNFSDEFSRHDDMRLRDSELYPVYQVPHSYTLPHELAYRYPLTFSSGQFAPRKLTYSTGTGPDMKWVRSKRAAFGLRANRTEQVYQQKLSRWAKGREKVQHAATTHATWLSGLCEELKEYGAKYTRVEGEIDSTSGETQLIQDEHED
ncbi:unnamed protein product [Phytophthora lilii]|uniref:Unnamed protein product n=1 Tax=Phytophthora lilii TaxID=2077276 RepID=A0A9W6XCV9_9STRA|nr:unnamed protein product [Phytophthora lilii]